jgi:hypothetical protein
LSLEVKVACWWEGLHPLAWSMVLQAVEEPPQCFAVCALAASSTLPHHQVAAVLNSPATSFPQALKWYWCCLQPTLYNSLYLTFLSSHLFVSPHQSTLHLHSFYIFGEKGRGKNQL